MHQAPVREWRAALVHGSYSLANSAEDLDYFGSADFVVLLPHVIDQVVFAKVKEQICFLFAALCTSKRCRPVETYHLL